MATIKITFHKTDGAITSETNGVKGSKCLQVDGFLTQLGEVKTKLSSEYYEDGQDSDVLINNVQS
jgi:hypothetical protein